MWLTVFNRLREKSGLSLDDLSERSGVCRRSLQNRLDGKVPFSYEDASTIQKRFFPDLTLDYLFEKEMKDKAS